MESAVAPWNLHLLYQVMELLEGETLAALVMACLAKRPEDRPPNARVVAAGLRAARERSSGLPAG